MKRWLYLDSALQKTGARYRCAFFLALACPLAAWTVNSERPLSQYSERVYQTGQGLPQNEVRSIAQTPDGYLWFGTRDGLARFDGVRFTVFRQETTPGIGHNMFGAMLVDHLGRLWIATGDGLSCYERGKFRRYEERDGLPTNAIHSLLEDGTGKLWIGTWNGLASFDGFHFHTYTTKDGLPHRSISGLSGDGQGGLWIGTYGGLAHMVNGRFITYRQKDGLPADVIESVLRDTSGRLWVGTLRGDARLTSAGRFEKIPELPGTSICLFEDRGGAIWAVTDRVFARLQKDTGSVFHPEEGPGRNVETVFEDREGSLWVGTYSSGVTRYRAGPFVSYTTREGLANDDAETVYEDAKANLWIGTSEGLSVWSHGAMRTVARNQLPVSGDIRSITGDDGGHIWVGTAKGIARFDGHAWQQVGAEQGMPVAIHVLYTDREGRMWIGSPDGITLWDHGRVSRITQREGLPGNYVMAILEDHRGRIWIGTVTGLACLDSGRVITYTKADGLLSNYIQSLYEDAAGTLWICTPSGLHRYKEGRFRPFTVKDGTFSNSPLQVLEDDRRNFWISSYRGIFRVAKDDLNAFADGKQSHVNAVSYGTEDGMKSSACSGLGRQPAGWKAKDGTLWFPTDHGVVSVNPARLPPPYAPPAPELETVLNDGIAATGTTVGPEVHRTEFVFTAPSSIAPEDIEFRYRMQGYEDQWREVSSRRPISFTHLPPGSYRFEVSARRPGGEWGTREASALLQVLPHFYETPWFYAASGLLGMLLLWFAHSYRLRQTERRLEAVMAERSRVAQELHDTLLQSLSGTAMQIQAALKRLSQGAAETGFQQLSTALEHMGRSMTDARQAIWDLKSPELLELPLDRALEAVGLRVCAGGPRLSYAVRGKPKPLGQSLEKQIYRICVEAITNAVRHSGCHEILVELDYREESVGLWVRDDGCGFDASRALSARAANRWGLAGMGERAKQCAGRFTIESAPGKGTDLRFQAPLLSEPATL